MVLANTNAATSAQPAARSAVAQAASVAPVVATSSTRTTRAGHGRAQLDAAGRAEAALAAVATNLGGGRPGAHEAVGHLDTCSARERRRDQRGLVVAAPPQPARVQGHRHERAAQHRLGGVRRDLRRHCVRHGGCAAELQGTDKVAGRPGVCHRRPDPHAGEHHRLGAQPSQQAPAAEAERLPSARQATAAPAERRNQHRGQHAPERTTVGHAIATIP